MSLVQANKLRKDVQAMNTFKDHCTQYRLTAKDPIERKALTKKIASLSRNIRRAVDQLMELHNSGHDLD